ncbi:hypothetical protein [Luteitalea sp.]|uniref:hypothetical protein n=1 Tax=Luteitalea sp. TaxID=2004800 RepID=UPI0025BC8F05|nr:hypothetical protein [Luteitalea sp.]
MTQVPNDALILGKLPREDAPLQELERFAATFGNFEQCDSLDDAYRIAEGAKTCTLADLRAALFLIYRAERFSGHCGAEDERRMRRLMGRIRDRVKARCQEGTASRT